MKLYFLRHHRNDQIIENYREEFEQLLSGRHSGLHPEKLSNGLISIRTSRSTRLLFAPSKIDGTHSLIFLEVIEHHKYDANAFCHDSRIVRRYIENNKDELLASGPLDLERFQNLFQSAGESIKNTLDHPSELYEHAGRCVLLDKDQQCSIETPWPVIVCGPPGSGETLVLLLQLERYAEEYQQEGRVIFIAKSSALLAEVERLWKQSLFYLEALQVDSKTINDFLPEQGGTPSDIFEKWWHANKKCWNIKKNLAGQKASHAIRTT